MSVKIDLYCAQCVSGRPSPSPFSQKMETILRASGFTDYEKKYALPWNGPKGKLPWVAIHTKDPQTGTEKTETIPDTHFILCHLLENKIIQNLDEIAGLTPVQKAESRAWQCYVEEAINPTVVWVGWFIPANREVSRKIFNVLPWPLRPLVEWYMYRQLTTQQYHQGPGRHTKEENLSVLKLFVDNLRDRLAVNGGGDWFHGTKPTFIDATIYSILAIPLVEDSAPEFCAMVLTGNGVGKEHGGEIIRNYMQRCTKLWFPEYEGLLKRLE